MRLLSPVLMGAVGVLLSGLLGGASADAATPIPLDHYDIQPATTGPGISSSTDHHLISVPTLSGDRKDIAVIFLPGTFAATGAYQRVTDEAALNGFGAVDLNYPNGTLAATICGNGAGSDACYRQVHGESDFGAGVVYGPGVGPYDYVAPPLRTKHEVTKENSVVNRVVGVLDTLAYDDAQAGRPAYWGQFLVDDSASPYVATHRGTAVYPDWSKIVVAGHSQGGSNATFLGSRVAVRRVVAFSAPQDNVSGTTASWITDRSVTAPSRFWGLRYQNGNQDEGVYGDRVEVNWPAFGAGDGFGGPGNNGSRPIGDGSGPYGTEHQLVLTSGAPLSTLQRHNSTAVDTTNVASIEAAWDRLLTGGGAD